LLCPNCGHFYCAATSIRQRLDFRAPAIDDVRQATSNANEGPHVLAHEPRSQMLSRLRADQSRRWRRGDRVRVESYLDDFPELASDAEALLALVHAELMLRREGGDTPTLGEYLDRFPQHAETLRHLWAAQALLLGDPSTHELNPTPTPAPPALGDFE